MASEMATDAVPWRNRITRHADVPPSELVAHPLNARRHGRMQADALNGVLSEVGVVQSVIVNERTGRMLDGHLRAELALARREPSVPVVYVDLDESEERLILATFDPLGAMADADRAALGDLLGGLRVSDAALATLLETLAPRPVFSEGDDGRSPAERLVIFEANQIRQISLHYAAEDYAEAVELLDGLRVEYGEDNNAEAVLRLLREHARAEA
jgi:hypothetical protein